MANRFVYTDEVSNHSFLIAYCLQEEAWGLAPYDESDPCSYVALSQETESYDVSTTGHLPWRFHATRDNSLVDTSSFQMQCVDCDSYPCNPGTGVCFNNRCECNDNRYGIHCEFRAPCEELVLDLGLGDFPPIPSLVNEDYVVLDSSYSLLKDNNGTAALSYHRPVYYSPGFKYLLMFTGRRWGIVSPRLLWEEAEIPSEDELRTFLLSVFKNEHMYDSLSNPNLQQFVVSEEVEIGSPIDNGLPIGLRWLGMRVVRSGSRPVVALDRLKSYDAMFICAFCEDGVNDCEHFGICNNSTKTCECTNGTLGFPLYAGALCEAAVTCSDVKDVLGVTAARRQLGNATVLKRIQM